MAQLTERTGPLNSLLRGELSAIETYRQALEKVDEEPGAAELRRIDGEHREAAKTLRELITQRGGKAESSSGAWGAFARAIEGTAKLFGCDAAIKALKEGEEHGVKEYEEALEDETLDDDAKTAIRTNLLPQQRDHIHVLDHLTV